MGFLDFTLPDAAWTLVGVLAGLVVAVSKQRRDERQAARLSSGTVATSDAATIFAAAENLRHDMAAQLDRLQTELHDVRLQAEKWRDRVVELEDEVEELRSRLRVMETQDRERRRRS